MDISAMISLGFIEIWWLNSDSETRRTTWDRSCFIDLFSQEFQELININVVEVQYLSFSVHERKSYAGHF